VTAPNGGETLYTGSSYRIDWMATGLVSRFDVETSSDGGATYVAVPGCSALAGTIRSCTWASPGPATPNGRVRVTARDAAGAQASDVSNGAFTIASGTATITVSYPNTAINAGIGSLQEIKWNHNLGANAFVRIELSRDGGLTYGETLADAVKNTGSTAGTFAWRVSGPATTGGQARIRVSWTNGAASDASNTSFTIAPVFISVAAPTASANWGFGTTQKQTWTTNLGSLDTVDVQLSTNGSAGPFTTLSERCRDCGQREYGQRPRADHTVDERQGDRRMGQSACRNERESDEPGGFQSATTVRCRCGAGRRTGVEARWTWKHHLVAKPRRASKT
jgi:hypothetical protein